MGGFEYLTNLAVRCPLPNPLPRGEGNQVAENQRVQDWESDGRQT